MREGREEMSAREKMISKATSAVGDRQYREWLKSLKGQIRRAQAKAAVRVNVELLRLYWGMGRDIAEKRMDARYGSGFFENLSRDLKLEFPDMEGFSPRNLRYVQAFYRFYSRKILHQPGAKSLTANRQQPVDDLDKLFSIPWGHNIEIFTHAKSVEEGLFYVAKTAENGWNRPCRQSRTLKRNCPMAGVRQRKAGRNERKD
jgi:predicted nuclease of restriction endonuclease-like (RecB) superfamily